MPKGTLSEKLVHTSKICDGLKSDYWIYMPAQYDPKVPSALMAWHDGAGKVDRYGDSRARIVIDNLKHRKKIPVIITVFISPADISGAEGTPTYTFVKNFSNETKRTLKDSMRGVAYDTVSDHYARMPRDQLLPEVYAKYSIRKDAYSRVVIGNSLGGISAFNIAWQQPDQFSRVITRIGTYTGIQLIPGVLDGGNVYPDKVRTEPKPWKLAFAEYSDGPLGEAPRLRFPLRVWRRQPQRRSGNAQNPEELTWLWRNYDPAKTEQPYAPGPAEKDKPFSRVKIANRW